jgi:hypothetical protein
MQRRRAILVVLMLAFRAIADAAAPAPSATQPTGPSAHVGLRAPPPNVPPPGQVRIGMFLYAVQELDVAKHSFHVSFNVWWRYHGDAFDPLQTLQVVSARDVNIVLDDKRALPGGDTYVDARVDAVIDRVLDTRAFPFDSHRLRIEIESPFEDDYLQYVIDREDSMLDPEVYSPGWHISDFSIHEDRKHYPTDFGLKERTNDKYSRAIVEVTAQHVGWRLAIDYFVGFITCVLICLAGYLVHPRMLPARATMIGTAVFSAVGNKYVVNSLTDTSSGAQLANVVVVTSFSMVLILLLSSIACERMIEAGQTDRALKTNRTVGTFAATGCLLVALYVTWIATHG